MGPESTSGSGDSNETQVVTFHSGFGAHDFPVSGVFKVEPRNCPGFLCQNSIQLGKINLPPYEFRTFIEDMASEYHGDAYHLRSKNCNHFTDNVSRKLTGRHVPGWVNRLAKLGLVKPLSEYHEYLDEDATGSISNNTPRESPEVYETDSEKHLLSPPSGSGEVVFVKEARSDS